MTVGPVPTLNQRCIAHPVDLGLDCGLPRAVGTVARILVGSVSFAKFNFLFISLSVILEAIYPVLGLPIKVYGERGES